MKILTHAVTLPFDVADTLNDPVIVVNQTFERTLTEDSCLSLSGMFYADDSDEDVVSVSLTATTGRLVCPSDASGECAGRVTCEDNVAVWLNAQLGTCLHVEWCPNSNFHGFGRIELAGDDGVGRTGSSSVVLSVTPVAEAPEISAGTSVALTSDEVAEVVSLSLAQVAVGDDDDMVALRVASSFWDVHYDDALIGDHGLVATRESSTIVILSGSVDNIPVAIEQMWLLRANSSFGVVVVDFTVVDADGLEAQAAWQVSVEAVVLCATCCEDVDRDCAGMCHGEAVLDVNGLCCESDSLLDCAGACSGPSSVDAQNICCTNDERDCQGLCGGTWTLGAGGACCDDAVKDCGGLCGGQFILDRTDQCCMRPSLDCFNDCYGTGVLDSDSVCCIPSGIDCAGVCNGQSLLDVAGSCCVPSAVDCLGICGGAADFDDDGTCCLEEDRDCRGVCLGAAVTGVGGGCCEAHEFDCNGICFGGSVLDALGSCCATDALDCAGLCNGGSVLDSGNSCCLVTEMDCNGVCFGTSTYDIDGSCCEQALFDCAGICSGGRELDGDDACCFRDDMDCFGVCGGPAIRDGEDTCCFEHNLDCATICFGDAILDACIVCGGDNSSCADCTNGLLADDICGVCDGDGTSCLDCAGEPFGAAMIDDCGICMGSNGCLFDLTQSGPSDADVAAFLAQSPEMLRTVNSILPITLLRRDGGVFVDSDNAIRIRCLVTAQLDTFSGVFGYELGIDVGGLSDFKTVVIPSEAFRGAGSYNVSFIDQVTREQVGVNSHLSFTLPPSEPDLSSAAAAVSTSLLLEREVLNGEIVSLPFAVADIYGNPVTNAEGWSATARVVNSDLQRVSTIDIPVVSSERRFVASLDASYVGQYTVCLVYRSITVTCTTFSRLPLAAPSVVGAQLSRDGRALSVTFSEAISALDGNFSCGAFFDEFAHAEECVFASNGAIISSVLPFPVAAGTSLSFSHPTLYGRGLLTMAVAPAAVVVDAPADGLSPTVVATVPGSVDECRVEDLVFDARGSYGGYLTLAWSVESSSSTALLDEAIASSESSSFFSVSPLALQRDAVYTFTITVVNTLGLSVSRAYDVMLVQETTTSLNLVGVPERIEFGGIVQAVGIAERFACDRATLQRAADALGVVWTLTVDGIETRPVVDGNELSIDVSDYSVGTLITVTVGAVDPDEGLVQTSATVLVDAVDPVTFVEAPVISTFERGRLISPVVGGIDLTSEVTYSWVCVSGCAVGVDGLVGSERELMVTLDMFSDSLMTLDFQIDVDYDLLGVRHTSTIVRCAIDPVSVDIWYAGLTTGPFGVVVDERLELAVVTEDSSVFSSFSHALVNEGTGEVVVGSLLAPLLLTEVDSSVIKIRANALESGQSYTLSSEARSPSAYGRTSISFYTIPAPAVASAEDVRVVTEFGGDIGLALPLPDVSHSIALPSVTDIVVNGFVLLSGVSGAVDLDSLPLCSGENVVTARSCSFGACEEYLIGTVIVEDPLSTRALYDTVSSLYARAGERAAFGDLAGAMSFYGVGGRCLYDQGIEFEGRRREMDVCNYGDTEMETLCDISLEGLGELVGSDAPVWLAMQSAQMASANLCSPEAMRGFASALSEFVCSLSTSDYGPLVEYISSVLDAVSLRRECSDFSPLLRDVVGYVDSALTCIDANIFNTLACTELPVATGSIVYARPNDAGSFLDDRILVPLGYGVNETVSEVCYSIGFRMLPLACASDEFLDVGGLCASVVTASIGVDGAAVTHIDTSAIEVVFIVSNVRGQSTLNFEVVCVGFERDGSVVSTAPPVTVSSSTVTCPLFAPSVSAAFVCKDGFQPDTGSILTATSCFRVCTSSADCDDSSFCNEVQNCEALREVGQPCAADDNCFSENCVDNICAGSTSGLLVASGTSTSGDEQSNTLSAPEIVGMCFIIVAATFGVRRRRKNKLAKRVAAAEEEVEDDYALTEEVRQGLKLTLSDIGNDGDGPGFECQGAQRVEANEFIWSRW